MNESTLPARPLRLWIPAFFVLALWAFVVAGFILDVGSFAWFLTNMAVLLVSTLGFVIWWLTRRALSWRNRLLALAAVPAFAAAVAIASTHTIKPLLFLFTLGLPCVLAASFIYIASTLGRTGKLHLPGLLLVIAAAWSLFLLIRVDNLVGDMRADIKWRWTPTAEELFLAQHPRQTVSTTRSAAPLTLREGDWPAFRGPQRDATVHNSSISLDWKTSPPKVLWRERVGPAWSSMVIVDGRLFTQEQRGENETTVCRDAVSGKELWTYADPIRFDEPMAGPGPRATPAFADGRLYTLGATGKLNCLDAATGKLIWSRDTGADSGAATPMWGYSSSPLAVDGRIFVYTGGDQETGLLAYPTDGGPPLWKTDAGKMGYASPQLFSLAGEKMILMITDGGLYAVDEDTGKLRSHFPVAQAVGVPPVAQPCRTADDSFVLGHGAGFGAALVQFTPNSDAPTRKWVSNQLKPSFSDMVFHQGYIYGFDGSVFCCVDAATGKRKWREGHYGAGQVILLADQSALIVATEKGQVILLRCNPDAHEELGSLEAVSGKLWNHLAFAHDRLFVRSNAEMTCLDLKRE